MSPQWDLSVKMFCEEEFSVKDRHYHCCKLKGPNRIECFNNNAANPNYDPTEELPVPQLELSDNSQFDPTVCQRLYDRYCYNFSGIDIIAMFIFYCMLVVNSIGLNGSPNWTQFLILVKALACLSLFQKVNEALSKIKVGKVKVQL